MLFVLVTDLKKEASDFRAKFAADFTRQLHDYQFPEEEVTQFIDAYEKENAKRAKLTYKVKQYLPDKVVISLNPETVSMEKTIFKPHADLLSGTSKRLSRDHRSEPGSKQSL